MGAYYKSLAADAEQLGFQGIFDMRRIVVLTVDFIHAAEKKATVAHAVHCQILSSVGDPEVVDTGTALLLPQEGTESVDYRLLR